MIAPVVRLVAHRPGIRSWTGPRVAGISSLSLLLLALGSTVPVRAQSGWIVVSEPREWSDHQRLSAPVDTRVRVVGQAFHPEGIESVSIGDEPAELEAVAGGVVEFKGYVAIRRGTRGVAIEAMPSGGEPVVVMFAVTATAPAPRQDAAVPADTDPPSEPVEAPPPERDPPEPAEVGESPGAAEAAEAAGPARAGAKRYNPAAAALSSLMVPGLGQLYTGRKLRGALFLGAAAGAVATGLLSNRTTVQCLEPLVEGECPPGAVHSEEDEQPYLMLGIAGAGVVALAAAIDGYLGAKRLNRAAARTARTDVIIRHLARLHVGAARGGVGVGVRIPF